MKSTMHLMPVVAPVFRTLAGDGTRAVRGIILIFMAQTPVCGWWIKKGCPLRTTPVLA